MNAEQKHAYDNFVNGINTLLTGAAGTGKSYTLKELCSWARSVNKKIGLTAMTGSAAVLVGGRTLHSFLGIGLGKKPSRELATWIINKAPHIAAKLRSLDILIIEEVSMLDAALLDKISEVLKIIRGNEDPMGGLQVLFLGDFTQLPPIHGQYCFKADVWSKLNMETVELVQLMRQKDDIEFQNILEEVRWGKCSKPTLARLRKLKLTKFGGGVRPTVLFPTNVDVDTINEAKYKELIEKGASPHMYKTAYSNDQARSWATSCKIPDTVNVCNGAQVVITWNVSQDDGIVNGTRGVIKKCDAQGVYLTLKDGKDIHVKFVTVTSEDSKSTWITFLPIKLAWALTIHKSQGMTLDAVILALGDVFEYGQAYTALSRVRDLSSLKILSVEMESFKTHPDVVQFYACKRAHEFHA